MIELYYVHPMIKFQHNLETSLMFYLFMKHILQDPSE